MIDKGVLPVLLVVLIALPGSFATCPSLSPLSNGNIAYSDPIAGSVYPFVTVATHACDDLFQLTSGDELRVCLSDGMWSGDAPECIAMTSTCASLTPPPNGMITYASDTTPDFDPGTIATYSCSNGFGLSGGDTVRTCQGQPIGAWSGTEPTCEAITCMDITDPLNGQITFSPDTLSPFLHGTIASYSCTIDGENRIGYGLDGGNATRTCVSNGTSAIGDWDGTAPTCELIMCPVPAAPQNGSVSFDRNFRRTVSYSCDSTYGFSSGSRIRTCRGTDRSPIGFWDGSEPVCDLVMCVNGLSAPSNGAITYSIDTTAPFDFGTTATYSCPLDQGYQLVANPSVRTCAQMSDTSTGFWNPTFIIISPRCDYIWCSPLSVPSNVMVTYGPDTEADYVPGTVATLTCSGEGFGITGGNMQRTCGSGRIWSGTTITCGAILCPDIPNPANGRIDFAPDVTAFFDYATTATYVCNVGFGISGANTTRICGGDGTSTTGVFSGIAPTCAEIMCLPLPVLANGQITYSTDTTPNYDFTTEATYSCNADFSLVGDVVRTCGGDGSSDIGTWSLTEPTCEPITCPSLPDPDNGQVIYSTSPLNSTNFEIRTTASYSCNVGFGITGGSGDRACGGDGSSVIGVWDGSAPTCEPIMCPDLVDPANGQINFSPDVSALFDFGTTATYTCDTGFGLVGEFTTRMCGGDGSSAVGEWPNVAPTFELIFCSELTAPVNVQINYSPDTTGPEFDFGTTATFSCNTGFGLTGGGVSSTCEGDGSNTTGTWSVAVPTCEVIQCPSLGVFSDRVITYAPDMTDPFDYGTIATYACNAGFVLIGVETRGCEGDGSSVTGNWNGTEPTCSPIVCPDLPDPSNGFITFGMENVLPSETNMDPPFEFMSTAMYDCNTGYGLFGGDTVRTCGGETLAGVWNGTAPTCLPIDSCPDIADPVNGQIDFVTDQLAPFELDTQARYSCSSGLGLDGGNATRWCEGDGNNSFGVWNGTAPSCVGITCAALMDATNGAPVSYDMSPDGMGNYPYDTVATFSCMSGFGTVGAVTRTCGGDGSSMIGTFDGSSPTCEAIMCEELTFPSNGQINYTTDNRAPFEFGTVATYECDSGYTFRDSTPSTRTCVGDGTSTNGTWTGVAPACEDIDECTTNTDNCDANAICTNTIGSFNCTCSVGWTGDGVTCNDIDECQTGEVNCTVNSQCNNTPGSFVCTCNVGYERSGDICDDIDECVRGTHDCSVDAACSNTVGSFNCSCNEGFVGNGVTCEAITCAPLSMPNYTEPITYNSGPDPINYAYATIATYTCSEGFSRSAGDEMRLCGDNGNSTDGIWSGIEPTCSPITCAPLADPMNSNATDYNMPQNAMGYYPYDTVATFSCMIGYGLVGSLNRTCGGDGSNTTGSFDETSPTCEPIMCPDILDPVNGRIDFVTDQLAPFDFRTVATYVCNDGYALDGDGVRICDGDSSDPNGAWNGTAPNCIGITCAALMDVTNGAPVSYDMSPDGMGNYLYDTVATFSCMSGFGTVGAVTRTCGGDGSSIIGTFDGSSPTCEVIMCEELTFPSNGQINYTTDNRAPFEFGTVATYECDSGYTFRDSTPSTRTCVGDGTSTNGTWTGVAPACEDIDECTTNTDNCDANAICTNTIGSFNCTCLVGWTGDGVTCNDIDECQTGETNCTVNSQCNNTPGSFVCTCNVGYERSGDTCEDIDECERGTHNCSVDAACSNTVGSFNCSCNEGFVGNGVTCEAITCAPLSRPNYTEPITYNSGPDPINYAYATIATYTCSEGFSRSAGDEMRMCGDNGNSTDGIWSGIEPTCSPITCAPLADPMNSNATDYNMPQNAMGYYPYDTVATFSCMIGYGLVGSLNRTCGGDGSNTTGSFDETSPTCEPITCPDISDPVNGRIDFVTDQLAPFDFRTVAAYVCNDGYELDGDGVRICDGDSSNPNGAWNGTAPNCIDIDECLTDTDNCDTNAVCANSVGSFDCTCNPEFSGDGVVCFDIDECLMNTDNCDENAACTNLVGNFGCSCNDGYSGDGITCIGIECPPLTNPANLEQLVYSNNPNPTNYTFSTTAMYACAEGFSISTGDEMRTCGGNGSSVVGTWSGMEPICTGITCPPLIDPMNANETVYDNSPDTTGNYPYGTLAVFMCIPGFGLLGSGTRTCGGDGTSVTGDFDGTEPVCTSLTIAGSTGTGLTIGIIVLGAILLIIFLVLLLGVIFLLIWNSRRHKKQSVDLNGLGYMNSVAGGPNLTESDWTKEPTELNEGKTDL